MSSSVIVKPGAGGVGPKPGSIKRSTLKNWGTAYLFLLPSLIGLVIFRLYPVVGAFVRSLYQTSFGAGGKEVFVGLTNYIDLLHDPIFWQSFKATLWLNLAINPIQICLAIAAALLVNRTGLAVRIYRTILMLPMGVSLAIACTLWGIMLNPNSGLVNSMLARMGLPMQPFLTSPSQAMWSIILIASWKGVAYWMIFILAGLQEIPEQIYEAARIDGVSAWQQLRYITLPLLKRSILFVTVADTTANFLLVVPMYMLTNGGPEMSTNVLMFEAYTSAFVYLDMPRALAITSVLLALLLMVVALQFRMLKVDY